MLTASAGACAVVAELELLADELEEDPDGEDGEDVGLAAELLAGELDTDELDATLEADDVVDEV